VSVYKILVNPADVVYIYDGSLAGFFCCVHESFYEKELPVNIISHMTHEPSLYEERLIKTDKKAALKVRESIVKNISTRAIQLTERAFLCHHENKELKLLKFLITAFRIGEAAPLMLGEETVAEVLKMERHLMGEQHLLLGFIRFKDYGDMLSAVISPKNFVLPLLADHFVCRFPNENFMIYDKTYKAALIYQDKSLDISAVEEIDFAGESEEELYYQELWKKFYDTIGIKERLNPRCRMSHMPKRYWENMVEMKRYL